MHLEQGVVEAQDGRPVGFGEALRPAMMAGNRRFQVERRDDGPLRRLGEEFLGAPDQALLAAFKTRCGWDTP